jgi:hypothetical protein
MRAVAIPIDRDDARRLGFHGVPLHRQHLGGRRCALDVARERVERRRQTPVDERTVRHRRQATLPRHVSGSADLEIREMRLARQHGEREAALPYLALEIVHDEHRCRHVLHEQLRLGACDLDAHVEPCIERDLDRSGEAVAVVELPVEAGVEHRRVLHGVRLSRLVLPQVDELAVAVVVGDTELQTEEAAARGGRDVHVDDAVAHLEILERGDAAVQREAGPSQKLAHAGAAFELPARRAGRERFGVRKRQGCEREHRNGKLFAHDSLPEMCNDATTADRGQAAGATNPCRRGRSTAGPRRPQPTQPYSIESLRRSSRSARAVSFFRSSRISPFLSKK